MTTATKPRKSHSRKSSAQSDARKAEIELAIQLVNDEAPDFALFMRRWGNRYNENNLRRLWVQCPNATTLHKFGTWRSMGRQVRKGEHAILLMQPRTGYSEDKITVANPEGKIFYGASWMALFDYSQTDLIGDFDDSAPDADPDLVAEARRLRLAAIELHPDKTGDDTEVAHVVFTAAWLAYEKARNSLTGDAS